MEKKIPIKNIYLLLVISIGLIGLGIGSTYAVFTAGDKITNPITFTSNLSSDNDVIEVIEIVVNPGVTEYRVLNITNPIDNFDYAYAAWYVDNGYSNDIIIGTETESGYSTSVILTRNTSTSIGVYIRNNGYQTATITIGVSSSRDTVTLSNNMKILPDEPLSSLANYVTNLYNSADKLDEPVVNNGIEYNYAPSASLMNDRLGSMDVDIDGGNIRYFGSNPNNYLYFNCDTYPETNCEKWRIIGVFNGKVKLIRDDALPGYETIGGFDWDYDYNNDLSSTSFSNEWNDASLNSLLNGTYYNNQNTVYYIWSGDGAEAVDANFKTDKIGIKNNITRNMIATVTYSLGGYGDSEVYSDEIYRYEREENVYPGNQATWTGKIALMYASDYGYATDFRYCNKTLLDYYSSDNNYACRSNDYLYIGTVQWLLNHDNNESRYVWVVSDDSYVWYDVETVNPILVRPVLFLDTGVMFAYGEGTSSNPYRIY